MTTAPTTFSSLGLDTVNIAKLGQASGKEPLVITPRWDCSSGFLVKWCQANRTFLDNMLIDHGAILVRGFDIASAHDMELAVKAYQPSLNDTYRGTSPRKHIDGTDFFFSAAEVPTNYPIAQHLEMSFLSAPPKQLFFGCVKPSSTAGGETALCDFAQVFADLPHDLKQKFLDKGILYTRTHKKMGTFFTYDVSDMLGWPELFGTNDKAQVEKLCEAESIPVTWTSGDTFVSTFYQDAFQLHPITGETVWFNHTQVFHWTTFPAELWFAFTRTLDWRLLLHCLFVSLFCVIKYGLLGHKMSLHATFGDGSSISVAEMNEIRDAIHKNMIFSRWQKGDMIFIDNFSMSHGRQPTYDTGRKVVVAWADPQHKSNAVTSIEEEVKVTDDTAMVCLPNPQERTPESSLTNQAKAELYEDVKQETIQQAVASFSENPQDVDVSEATLDILKRIVAQAESRKASEHCHSEPVTTSGFWQNEE